MLSGIDISKWQDPTPNLTGLSFVFARAAYGDSPDLSYPTHSDNVHKAGIVLGAYLFGRNLSGRVQAETLLSIGANAELLALDLEADARYPRMSDAQAEEFIATIHAAGRKIGLYHSQSGFPSLGQDWNWIAKWSIIAPPKPWTFWQHRGSPLDLNYFDGTEKGLRALGDKPMSVVLPVSNFDAMLVDCAIGVQFYMLDGTPLVKLKRGGNGITSPFLSGSRRAVVISTNGVVQLALVNGSDCQNIRLKTTPDTKHAVTLVVDGKTVYADAV